MSNRHSIKILTLALIGGALMGCRPTKGQPPSDRPIDTVSTVSNPHSEMPDTTMSPCDRAMHQIRTRDLRAWSGLPAECDWTPWTGPLPTDWQEVYKRPMHRTTEAAGTFPVPVEGYYRPLLTFLDGKAALFDGSPDLTPETHAALIAAYKAHEPAAKLEWEEGTMKMPATEWVFPDRGITLFLNDDEKTVAHIALYAPTTLAYYTESLRPKYGKQLRH